MGFVLGCLVIMCDVLHGKYWSITNMRPTVMPHSVTRAEDFAWCHELMFIHQLREGI